MGRKWLGLALASWCAACGTTTANEVPEDPEMATAAGAGGASAGSGPDGGGAGADAAPGGAGGTTTNADVTGAALLAGRAFTFASSLCSPQAGWEASGEAEGVSSLYVRRTKAGGLEIVTYTRAEGAPVIEVHPLEQDGDAWRAKDVAGCAWLYGYEDFSTEVEKADWRIRFLPIEGADAMEAVVTAAFEDGEISATARPDVTPPALSTFAEARPFRGLVDGFGSGDFSRYFVFSEPLSASDIVVRDRHGADVVISRYLETKGYVWGFVVTDDLSSEAVLSGQVEDLAGLRTQLSQPYPGVDQDAIDGEFEHGAQFETSDIWIGEGPSTCGSSGPTTAPEPLSLPPIAGQMSFHVDTDGWYGCSIFFRVARLESATKLSFIARRIVLIPEDRELGDDASDRDLYVCLSSLDADKDRACSVISPAWTPDETYSTLAAAVSLPAEVSVDIPWSADDLWVEIQTQRRLWLDSLETK